MYLKQFDRVQAQGTNIRRPTSERSLAPGIVRTTNGRTSAGAVLPELEAQIKEFEGRLARFSTPLGMVEIWAGSRIPRRLRPLRRAARLKHPEYPELYKAIGSTYNNAYDCSRPEALDHEQLFPPARPARRFVAGYNVNDAD